MKTHSPALARSRPLSLIAAAFLLAEGSTAVMPQHPPIQLTTPYFPIELGYDLTDDLIALGFIAQGFAFTEATGCATGNDPARARPKNPFLDVRFTAKVTPYGQSAPVYLVPGFYAGDGTEGDPNSGDIGPGNVWKVRLTPEASPTGGWAIECIVEAGVGLSDGRPANVSDGPLGDIRFNNQVSYRTVDQRNIFMGPYVPSAPGFRGKGFVRFKRADGFYYYKFSNPALPAGSQFFLKTGTASPENLFGYREFYKQQKSPCHREPFVGFGGQVFPGTGVHHTFGLDPVETDAPLEQSHVEDWSPGMPEWVTTGWDTVLESGSSCQPLSGATNYANPAPTLHNSAMGNMAGHGIIGALQYLSDEGVNSIFVMPMNLGGDGRDTYPFASIDNNGEDATIESYDLTANSASNPHNLLHYSIKRMQEWNIVLDWAMQKGVFVQFILHEQEQPNLDWMGWDYDLQNCSCNAVPIPGDNTLERTGRGVARPQQSWAKRLYLKQMVAHFGHHLGIQWNLSEENSWRYGELPGAPNEPLDLTVAQLADMAHWIKRWDAFHDHPLAVHPEGDRVSLYEQVLAFEGPQSPEWLSATSMYIYASESDTTGTAAPAPTEPGDYNHFTEHLRLTTFAAKPAVISVDEQSNWRFGASGRNNLSISQQNGTGMPHVNFWNGPEGRRRLALYDILFSGGNLEWYLGVGPEVDGYPSGSTTYSPNHYFGGGDLSVESFRYRHELWKYTHIAGSTLRRVPFWKGVPCDSKVTGEVIDPVYGGAEVFASLYPGSPATDDFMLVYFPRTGVAQGAQLCSVDLSHAPSGGSYTGAFFNPESGAFLSMFLTNPNPGSAFAVTSPVSPDSDLLLIFVRQ